LWAGVDIYSLECRDGVKSRLDSDWVSAQARRQPVAWAADKREGIQEIQEEIVEVVEARSGRSPTVNVHTQEGESAGREERKLSGRVSLASKGTFFYPIRLGIGRG
jgi:hypothetical protein